MARPREYQSNAEKQWAYRQRSAKIEESKMLDRCAYYSIRDALAAAGYVVEGETRNEVVRAVEALIRNAERSAAAGAAVMVEL